MSDLSDLQVSFTLSPNDAENAAHLAFVGREHDTDGRDCWCRPTFYHVCDDCDDGCWKCNEGKSRITRAEALATDDVLLIVHNG